MEKRIKSFYLLFLSTTLILTEISCGNADHKKNGSYTNIQQQTIAIDHGKSSQKTDIGFSGIEGAAEKGQREN